jgi:WD40 repeat protein
MDSGGTLIAIGSDGIVTEGSSGSFSSPQVSALGRIWAASFNVKASFLAVAPASAHDAFLFDRYGTPVPLPSGACDASLPGSGFVNAVALDNSASTLVAGYDDGRLCTIAIKDGRASTTQLTMDAISAVSVAPEHDLIAARTSGGDIVITSSDLAKRHPIRAGSDSGPALAWSPDASMLAAGCTGPAICVWRLPQLDTGAGEPVEIARFTASELSPTAIAWSKNGDRTVSADQRMLALWNPIDINGSAVVTKKISSGDGLTALAVSPGGTRLAMGTASGTRIIWDLATEQLHVIERADQEQGPIPCMAWHSSKALLASCTNGRKVSVTRWPDLRPFSAHTFSEIEHPTVLRWLSDGGRLAVGSLDGQIALWSPDESGPGSVRIITARTGQPADIQRLVLDRPRERLITTGDDGRILAWDLRDPGSVVAFEDAGGDNAHARARSVLVILNNDRMIATGNDGQLIIYDLVTGTIQRRFDAGGHQIDDAAVETNGSTLVTERPDGRVDIWLLDGHGHSLTPFASFTVKTAPRAVAFLPKTSQFAVATAAGDLMLFSSDYHLWRRRGEEIGPRD